MKVRFWAYVCDGFVKITLVPNQSLEWATMGPTDEGWHGESCRWHYDPAENVIRRDWCQEGRDCDGHLARYGSDVCSLDELNVVEPYFTDEEDKAANEGVMLPKWTKESRSQRDEYAEMAGY